MKIPIPMHYTLDADGQPVPCEDLLTWARWIETAERHVAETIVGRYRVSTVFLGTDLDFGDTGTPVLWETLIFPECEHGERYTSRQDAVYGHARYVDLALKLKDEESK